MASLSHVHSGLIASPAHTLVSAVAGTQAAAQGLNSVAPALSLAEFCETHLRQLLTHVDPNNAASAMAVLRQAYAGRIAVFIAGGKRHG